jgi:hypothetical protein
MQIKSKKKNIEAPVYEISLQFNNNLFQTYLFEIFEKFNISLSPVEMQETSGSTNVKLINTIKIHYKNEYSFIKFLDKDSSNIKELFISVEIMLKLVKNSKNIIIIFFQLPNNLEFEKMSKNNFIFFLTSELKIKVFECNNNNDLVEFLNNYTEAVLTKEDKSKITFYDTKPVTSTNLCELEGITNEKSVMFVKHLMCIPGISERKAISVVQYYPTLADLMNIYSSPEYNENEKENMLRDVEIIDKVNNTTKKLGSALSIKIYKCLFSNDINTIIN